MTTSIQQFFDEGCGRCELSLTPQCKAKKWLHEIKLLRELLLSLELDEEVKWGFPCYSQEGKNIVMLGALKDCCTLSFFKGALLQEKFKFLEKAGPNSEVARLIKFDDTEKIKSMWGQLEMLVRAAIEVEKSGKKIERTILNEQDWPDELLEVMAETPGLKKAFQALTPGRQRGYIIHFSSAKTASTRKNRIQKYIDQILIGKGWNDR